MLNKIRTAALSGAEGYPVTVETDLRRGMPEFAIVGLADTTIRESCKRVRPAIENSGYPFPMEKLTVNLMPAARPKEGSHFDLPIAVGIVMLMESVEVPTSVAFLGELSLDGRINPVRGVLPMVICLRKRGIKKVILPRGNGEEAAALADMEVYGAGTLNEVIDHLRGEKNLPLYTPRKAVSLEEDYPDYEQVIGQESVKRAMVIGAAGNHGMLMMGSPGCGKTMMARRLPSILPPMTYEEQLEVTGIYSIAGLLAEGDPVMRNRPFRSPHHSISLAGLIGGGVKPRPGELSLAHRGVLFLDELGEFESRAIDGLRQPIEEGLIRITRNNEEMIFPSRVMVVVASNPCKCGNLWDSKRICTCTPRQIQSHRRRLMGPFTDRIDMHIRMMPVDKDILDAGAGSIRSMSSEAMRRQVEKARKIQMARYDGTGYKSNANLDEKGIELFCGLHSEGKNMMMSAYERLGLSMRGYHRIIKLSRTIADLDEEERIKTEHIAEALAYRTIERDE